MEKLTTLGLEIKCSCKGCKRYIRGDGDIIFKQYTRKHAIASGYVKKGDYWLCGEHKNMTMEQIEAQWKKKEEQKEEVEWGE